MRVKDCKTCSYCERREWLQYFEPPNRRPVTFAHVYYFCTRHNRNVAKVKRCKTAIRESLKGA